MNATRPDDLARQARMFTTDVSGTVEQLLMAFIAAQKAKRTESQAATQAEVAQAAIAPAAIAWANEHYAAHDLPGADFSPL